MRPIAPDAEATASNVRAVFQSPHQYTAVLHHLDGFLSLYDEPTLDCVALSKNCYSQPIAMLVFSRHYGTFYAYFSPAFKNQAPYLVAFRLEERGRLHSWRHSIAEREGERRTTGFHSMGLFYCGEKNKEELLILFEKDKCSLVSPQGKILTCVQMTVQKRTLNTSKSYQLKKDRFLLVEERLIISAHIADTQFHFEEQLRLENSIQETYLDSGVSHRYLGIVTKDNMLHLASIKGKYTICYTLPIPFFSITHLCFFYPGVNTSPTNKLKDRVFVVFHGGSLPFTSQRSSRELVAGSGLLSDSPLSACSVYLYEFKECFPANSPNPFQLKPQRQFHLETGAVRQLLFNHHELNCFRVVSDSGQLLSYSLSCLFEDKEWTFLAFRFQRIVNGHCIQFEPREDEFELKPYRSRFRGGFGRLVFEYFRP